MAATYFIGAGTSKRGPFTLEQLVNEGLAGDSLVWAIGMAGWARADSVDELRPVLAQLPPPVPGADVVPSTLSSLDGTVGSDWSQVQRLTAALFWLHIVFGLYGLVWLLGGFENQLIMFLSGVPIAIATAVAARAANRNVVIWAVLALIPVANLLVAVALSQLAGNQLKKAGAEPTVGFLGPRVDPQPPAGFRGMSQNARGTGVQ